MGQSRPELGVGKPGVVPDVEEVFGAERLDERLGEAEIRNRPGDLTSLDHKGAVTRQTGHNEALRVQHPGTSSAP